MALQFTLAGLQDVNCTDEIKQVFSDIALENEAVLRIVPPKFEECTKQLAELFIDDSNVKELINVEVSHDYITSSYSPCICPSVELT